VGDTAARFLFCRRPPPRPITPKILPRQADARLCNLVRARLAVVRVRVLFFGILKDAAGKSSDLLDLPAGASARDVINHYSVQSPALKRVLPSLAVAVNQHYASADTNLEEGDEIALLPPVSGGSESSRHVSIVRKPIETNTVLKQIKSAEDGAAVVFEGVVRNQTRGRKTLYLDYEAYEEMALRQMETLAEQALRQFQIRDLAIVHRLGRLQIGEISVLIVVASAHRSAAFDACHWLIDTLKRTVPIWKKEYFEDGAVWADGEPFPDEIPHGSSLTSGSPNRGLASK
jgi:MoaE-MoaD fusion protein